MAWCRLRAVALRCALSALAAGGCSADGVTAELVVPQDVPADVRRELDVTWERFIERFAGRLDCIGDVTVVLVRAVEGGDARYVPTRSLIEIQIPTTPARFRESVAHELAHHVEHSCDEFAELKDVLHARLGGPEVAWFGDGLWHEQPAERWAESVVELVNGERVRHADELIVDPIDVALIEEWGRDSVG